jgi:hypothetical protein
MFFKETSALLSGETPLEGFCADFKVCGDARTLTEQYPPTKKELIELLLVKGYPYGLAEQLAAAPTHAYARFYARVHRALVWVINALELSAQPADIRASCAGTALWIAGHARIGGNRGLGLDGPSNHTLLPSDHPAEVASIEAAATICGAPWGAPTLAEIQRLSAAIVAIDPQSDDPDLQVAGIVADATRDLASFVRTLCAARAEAACAGVFSACPDAALAYWACHEALKTWQEMHAKDQNTSP